MAISQKLKKKILNDIDKLLKEGHQLKKKRFGARKWNGRSSKSSLKSQREVNKLIRAIRSGV